MFARVTDITAPADQLDAGIAGFTEQVLPAARGMQGFVRAYLLVDRESGRALSVTVWETEEAMRASEEAANQLRSSVTSDMGATTVSVGRFEIAVSEPSDG